MVALDPIDAMEEGEEVHVDDKGNITPAENVDDSEKGVKMKPTRWA
ncbi:hypothetical protein [Halorubrum sp. GN11_10-6_MGM]|nr:hypothetical protein [Halorubrum sp. GN11_10-6_MGM]